MLYNIPVIYHNMLDVPLMLYNIPVIYHNMLGVPLMLYNIHTHAGIYS